MPFASKNNTAAAAKIRERWHARLRVRMRADAAHIALLQLIERFGKMRGIMHRQSKNRAHGAAHRSAQIRTARSLADDHSIYPKRCTIPQQRAKVLRVADSIHGNQKRRAIFLNQHVERNRWWNFPH